MLRSACFLSAGLLASWGLTGCGDQVPSVQDIEVPDLEDLERSVRRKMDPPVDLPDWSSTEYVRWTSLRAPGERAIIIDVTDGQIDKILDDENVTVLLNKEYQNLFLHPRSRPTLTQKLGWPVVALLDPNGCIRASGSPTTADELVALLNQGLEARKAGTASGWPAAPAPVEEDEDAKTKTAGDEEEAPAIPYPDLPTDGGTWTLVDPSPAAVFVQPQRGAPAVVFEDRPYLFGGRAETELHTDRPAARVFLDELPDEADYSPTEGPLIACDLEATAAKAPTADAEPTEDNSEQGKTDN